MQDCNFKILREPYAVIAEPGLHGPSDRVNVTKTDDRIFCYHDTPFETYRAHEVPKTAEIQIQVFILTAVAGRYAVAPRPLTFAPRSLYTASATSSSSCTTCSASCKYR
jgi:hypothetical protein